jgi:hypothetical protein
MSLNVGDNTELTPAHMGAPHLALLLEPLVKHINAEQ